MLPGSCTDASRVPALGGSAHEFAHRSIAFELRVTGGIQPQIFAIPLHGVRQIRDTDIQSNAGLQLTRSGGLFWRVLDGAHHVAIGIANEDFPAWTFGGINLYRCPALGDDGSVQLPGSVDDGVQVADVQNQLNGAGIGRPPLAPVAVDMMELGELHAHVVRHQGREHNVQGKSIDVIELGGTIAGEQAHGGKLHPKQRAVERRRRPKRIHGMNDVAQAQNVWRPTGIDRCGVGLSKGRQSKSTGE